MGKKHPSYVLQLNNISQVLKQQVSWPGQTTSMTRSSSCPTALMPQGKLGEAEKVAREALSLARGALGKEHPGYATCLHNLAQILSIDIPVTNSINQDKTKTSENSVTSEHEPRQLYEEALGLWQSLYGPNHPTVADGLRNLALLLQKQVAYLHYSFGRLH